MRDLPDGGFVKERNMKIRIKFSKYGIMKYIGHLDMMRFFQKAVRRAGIDVRYSEGFSPHQIMSFAAPLGVGMESGGEYMDLEVLSMTTAQEMKEALNRAMVEGVEILSVIVLPDNAKNAMASVAAASYRLQTKAGDFPIGNLPGTLTDFLAQETIPYTKETKKSVVELNLRQGIYELAAESGNAVRMMVNASSSGNIKPAMVMDALGRFAGVEIPENSYRITKLETYAELSDADGNGRFVPLDSVS